MQEMPLQVLNVYIITDKKQSQIILQRQTQKHE